VTEEKAKDDKNEANTERKSEMKRNPTEGCDNPICVVENAGIMDYSANVEEVQQPGHLYVAQVEDA